jgi:hypothetical protein
MIEIAARECVFHFNKHHLVDPTTPMWVLKTKGKTYMVNHVDSTLPWSTKETSENPHTKGSIKFKNALVTIDDSNSASLSPLTLKDVARLKTKEYTRILIMGKSLVMDFINLHGIRHTPLKEISGRCGSTFNVCDIQKPGDITSMQLGISSGNIPYNNFFRILQENEPYYKVYTDDSYMKDLDPDFDADGLIQDDDDFDDVEENEDENETV